MVHVVGIRILKTTISACGCESMRTYTVCRPFSVEVTGSVDVIVIVVVVAVSQTRLSGGEEGCGWTSAGRITTSEVHAEDELVCDFKETGMGVME